MLRRILLFDVNRVLHFDVNRILNWDVNRLLKWDVGRFLRRPIPIVLRAFLGWLIAGMLLAILVPLAARQGWRLNEWTAFAVIVACVLAAIAPDLRRRS